MSNKRFLLAGVLAYILVSLNCLSGYVPSINADMQTLQLQEPSDVLHDRQQLSGGLMMPFVQMRGGALFTDLRFSYNRNDLSGIHVGLGGQKEIGRFNIAGHVFYDKYLNDGLRQVVAGLQVWNRRFEISGNLYSPFSKTKSVASDFAYKGGEVEVGLRVAAFLLSAKYYQYKSYIKTVEGRSFKVQYTTHTRKGLDVYTNGIYQYDNLFNHHFMVNVGISIAKKGKHYSKKLKRPERNLGLYGYTKKMYQATALKSDNLNNISNYKLLVVPKDLTVNDTIKLSSGQTLMNADAFYGRKTKEKSVMSKISFNQPNRQVSKNIPLLKLFTLKQLQHKPLVELQDDVTIEGVFFDGGNISAKMKVANIIPGSPGAPQSFTVSNVSTGHGIHDYTDQVSVLHAASSVKNITIKDSYITTNNGKVAGIKFDKDSQNTRITGNTIILGGIGNKGIDYSGTATGAVAIGNVINIAGKDSIGIDAATAPQDYEMTGNTFKIKTKGRDGKTLTNNKVLAAGITTLKKGSIDNSLIADSNPVEKADIQHYLSPSLADYFTDPAKVAKNDTHKDKKQGAQSQ